MVFTPPEAALKHVGPIPEVKSRKQDVFSRTGLYPDRGRTIGREIASGSSQRGRLGSGSELDKKRLFLDQDHARTRFSSILSEAPADEQFFWAH